MFGLFRRRRSKWEIARDAVVDTIHHALEYVPTDRIEEWRENVVEAALQGRQTAGEAARGAASTVSTKAGTVAAKAGTVAAKAGTVAAHAGETAEGARESLSEAFSRLRESAANLAQSASHSAHDAAEHASQVAGNVAHSSHKAAHGALGSVHDKAEDLRDRVSHIELPRLSKKARKAQERLEREARERAAAAEAAAEQAMQRRPEIEVDDSSSKLLWFAVGLLTGAVIAILVAPAAGRRSRAVIKDKLNQGKREAAAAASAASGKAADLGRRAAGKVQETLHAAQPDDADDSIIADRVRTELGENPATRELERINVDVANGVVTLRGPIVEAAQSEAIDAVVRSVKGVLDVKVDLHIASNPEEDATFVG